MRLRRMQHSGTHCVAFFGTRGRQEICDCYTKEFEIF
jgi:hypothetical protein